MLGEADRAATPTGGIEAAAASWTLEAEEDGPRAKTRPCSEQACQIGEASRLRTARARRAGPPKARARRGERRTRCRAAVPP